MLANTHTHTHTHTLLQVQCSNLTDNLLTGMLANTHTHTHTHLQVQCSNLTDKLLTGMLANTPALISLELDSCDQITDNAFNDLWEHRMQIDMGEVTGVLQSVAVCCSVLQCVAVCCGVLQ